MALMKRTTIRLRAGKNGTAPWPATKMLKVGVSLWLMVVTTLGEGSARHWAVTGLD